MQGQTTAPVAVIPGKSNNAMVGTTFQPLEQCAMQAEEIKGQVQLIQQVMQAVMKENEHYGKIPGCGDKATLLKPGAEKLVHTFRFAPSYSISERDMGKNHREYVITCTLTSMVSGVVVGQGVGSCSTMEGKYRFRVGEGESTGVAVPKTYWDTRNPGTLKLAANSAGFEGDKFQTKKIDGKWMITTHGERVEHDNPADYYNTVLKMAKKRALVDAALTATAASDIFTQDIEDMPETIPGARKQAQPAQPQNGPAPAGPYQDMGDMPEGFGNQPQQQQAPPSNGNGNGNGSKASQKQLGYIAKLQSDSGMSDDDLWALVDEISDSRGVNATAELTTTEASALIKRLQ